MAAAHAKLNANSSTPRRSASSTEHYAAGSNLNHSQFSSSPSPSNFLTSKAARPHSAIAKTNPQPFRHGSIVAAQPPSNAISSSSTSSAQLLEKSFDIRTQYARKSLYFHPFLAFNFVVVFSGCAHILRSSLSRPTMRQLTDMTEDSPQAEVIVCLQLFRTFVADCSQEKVYLSINV
jgi:hypothetical protein